MKKAILTSWICILVLQAFSQTWEDLKKQILEHNQKGEYEKAIPVAEQAITVAKRDSGENHPVYFKSLYYLAIMYKGAGQFAKAEPYYLKAKEVQKGISGENNLDYATITEGLAIFYQQTGRYEKAELHFLQAKQVRQKLLGENSPSYTILLSNLATLYSDIGQYTKAGMLYEEASAIYIKNKKEKSPEYAVVLLNTGNLNKQMGNYQKAEQLYLLSQDILKETVGEVHPYFIALLNSLAVTYERTGDYEKAELLYMTCGDIQRKAGKENTPAYALLLSNLALLYSEIGQYTKAEALYLQSGEIRERLLGKNHPDYATTLSNLAYVYRKTNKYDKAEAYYIQAGEIRKKALGEDHFDYASGLDGLGMLYIEMGQFEKAEVLILKTNEILKKNFGEANPDYALGLVNLAQLNAIRNRYEKAEALFVEAGEIQKKVLGETHPYVAGTNTRLASLYTKMGLNRKAEPLILSTTAIQLQNLKNTFAILSEKEKGNYVTNKLELLDICNSLLYNFKEPSPALLVSNYNLQTFTKSLSLFDTRNMLKNLNNSKDTVVQNIFKEWVGNKGILARQFSLPLSDRMNKLDSVEERAEALEKELARKVADFSRGTTTLNISLQAFQKELRQDEAIVEFVRFKLTGTNSADSIIYAAYILNAIDSLPVFVPLCGERQLQKLFDSAGTTATAMVSKFYRGLELKNKNAAGALGTELYKLIWQPLEPYLKGIKKISYSPAGKLYGIAFHALPVDSTTILIDKYQLQQYTSTRQVALRNTESEAVKPANITLFGDANFSMDSLQLTKQRTNQSNTDVSTSIYTPSTRGADNNSWQNLPGTAEEIKKINSLFNQNKLITKTFTKAAASEENLKALGGNSPQILHIATHGFFLPEPDKKKKESGFDQSNTYTLANDPLLRTGLILAGANYAWSGKTPIDGVEDGIATAYEISQLNLSNTELVVLSACETALGDVKGSEGVFGLQRAFKMAGVKKMIVSLWQVPDKETAELMTSFYSYWMKGKKINDAFAQAQADMRKKYSPFYWAAFVMID